MSRSLLAVLTGTFTLRFSTGLTGTMLVYFLAELPEHGGPELEGAAIIVGIFAALFYVAELVLSPFFGLLSDRQGFHRVMQHGPLFGAVAVIITGFVPQVFGEGGDFNLAFFSISLITLGLIVIGLTRVLEGASTAASVPSILGYIALATADDEGLRGRIAARFELATIIGIGAGIGAAGPVWQMWDLVDLPRPFAFFLNGAFYFVSLAIFRWGVEAPERPAGPHHQPMYGIERYWRLIRSSHVWLLAPTWIAVNAALGLYATQSLFALVRTPDPRFADQLLAGGIEPLQVTLGLVAAGAIFIAGLVYWGERFKDFRRTTIIFYGIVGGAVMVVAAVALNYSAGWGLLPQLALLVPLAGGLFVLAGATPAALGLLADISEAYPDDRGAIMGLYSVFLAIGQIIGALIGGFASEWAAITGILLATIVLLGVALLPLWQLRAYEHRFVPAPGGPQPPPEPEPE